MVTHIETRRKTIAGFSLIELMVGMVLGLILLMGVTTMVVNSSQSYGELHKTSQQLGNGTYALEVIANDIRHAGYYGEFYRLELKSALPDPCSTTVSSLEDSLFLPVQGYDFSLTDTTASTLSCLEDHKPGTDILVIRRAATVTVPPDADGVSPVSLPTDDLDSNQVYLQTTAIFSRVALGSNAALTFDLTRRKQDASATAIPALIRPLIVHIYYIRSWSVEEGDNIPTLCRVELIPESGGSGSTMSDPIRLAEGIENLQLEYSMDFNSASNGAPTDNPDTGGIDVYTTSLTTTQQWFDVVSVRFYLLVRSIETSSGYQDSKVYNLGLAGEVTGSGAFRRRVLSTVVRVTNTGGRREVSL